MIYDSRTILALEFGDGATRHGMRDSSMGPPFDWPEHAHSVLSPLRR